MGLLSDSTVCFFAMCMVMHVCYNSLLLAYLLLNKKFIYIGI